MDSILIDEARTPLIISGPVEDRAHLYNAINTIIPELSAGGFRAGREAPDGHLTDTGNEHVER